MNTHEARDLGRGLVEAIERSQTEAAYAQLLPTLRSRTPFRLLDLIGQAVGTGPLQPATAFAERVATGKTEGGWVIVASILREQLARDLPGALERSRAFVIAANVWYAADILGERVPGPALLLDFEQALAGLSRWRTDPDRWVRRTVGVAVHFWAKRAHGEAGRGAQAEQLLSFLEPMFEERTVDAVKGAGWGLKTLGRYYPELAVEWLMRQTSRHPSALMLRKALTYLPPEQRVRVVDGFAR
jgi:hypothetical protein